ncbi:ionotropic receptor 40a-like isoform X2 [Oratosquilla oratoria]|uniref:ionotropic receptor 40a-like isoform X2 n=1 Tax=Oratosquilla oratoria TaxID=337810 RepID=UPI003F77421B
MRPGAPRHRASPPVACGPASLGTHYSRPGLEAVPAPRCQHSSLGSAPVRLSCAAVCGLGAVLPPAEHVWGGWRWKAFIARGVVTMCSQSTPSSGGNWTPFPLSAAAAGDRSLVDLVRFLLPKRSLASLAVVYEPATSHLIGPLAYSLSVMGTSVILREARGAGDFDSFHRFLLANFDQDFEHYVVLLIDDIDVIMGFFKQVRDRNFESSRLRWVVPVQGPRLVTGLEPLLREGTWLAVGVYDDDDGGVYVLSTRINQNGEVKLLPIGYWSSSKEKVALESENRKKPRGRSSRRLKEDVFPDLEAYYSDFGGRLMKTPALNNPMWYNLEERPDGTVVPLGGLDPNILWSLAQKLNFTYQLVTPPDRVWGNLLPNGSATGMVGMLARRQGHFCINGMSLTPTRASVVDFSNPYFIHETTIVTRAPRAKNRAFAIVEPFSLQVWLCLLASVVFTGLAIFLVRSAARKLRISQIPLEKTSKIDGHEKLHLETSSAWLKGFVGSVFNAFRCLVLQNDLQRAKLDAPRIATLAWYFFVLIVYVVYSGTLTSFLTLPAFEKPIDSLEDLYEAAVERGYGLALRRGTVYVSLLRSSKGGIYTALWKSAVHEEHYVKTPFEALDRMLNQKLAFMDETISMRGYTNMLGSAKYHIGTQTFYTHPSGIACQQGSPYINNFNKIVMSLEEAGLIRKWLEDQLWLVEIKGRKRSLEEARDKERLPILSLDHLQSALIVFGAGQVLGLLVLVFEVIIGLSKSKM